MDKPTRPLVQLRTLLNSRLGSWGLAWLLGIVTLLSAMGLLALSGWFITAAALAGLALAGAHGSLDIFVPAALIRFFALARTAGRYTERLASHDAASALPAAAGCPDAPLQPCTAWWWILICLISCPCASSCPGVGPVCC